MTFIQIVSFRTDRYAEFAPLETAWEAATQGRRTLLGYRALQDRNDPRHYVHLEEFSSYESAMVNSNLAETAQLAGTLTALADGPADFGDFDLIAERDERRNVADWLRESFQVGAAPGDVYADDIAFVGEFPDHVVRTDGPVAIARLLAAEAPGRTVERWDVTPTAAGFVVEYAYRTIGEATRYSRGVMVATLDGGRITRLLVTCAGSWDAADEQRILGTVAA